MSEVAIDALRVDLTRLLLSARSCGPAKGRPETDQIAQTTTLFRRCKQAGEVGKENESGYYGGGGAPGEKSHATTPLIVPVVAAAASRRSPLPQEVDRCVMHLTCMWSYQYGWILKIAGGRTAHMQKVGRRGNVLPTGQVYRLCIL